MPDPVLIEIGVFSIRWYGVLIASAVLIGTLLALKEVRRKGINEDHFMNILLVCIPVGFITTRLYYVAFNWDYYGQNLNKIFAVWEGGLAIHGGIIGSFLAGWFMVKYYQLNFWEIADAVAPSFILGQAIGRWGNYFNQEAYGYAVDPEKVPWAMFIDGAYRHPTFLYESIWNLTLFAGLIIIREKVKPKAGILFSIYIGGYSIGRFFIESFRTDSLMLGSLRAAQVTSIIMVIFAAGLAYYIVKKQEPSEKV